MSAELSQDARETPMTRKSQMLLKEAMEMPPKDRAAIAQRLNRSLDGPPDRDVEAAWKKEIDCRLKRFRSGKVQMAPWETIRDRLRKRSGL
jgi:putative addiction module component (TIGR02574 family)